MTRWVKGFTIIELLIIIVVIGIIASITITTYSGVQTRARLGKIETDLTATQKLIESYKARNGSYPVTASNLNPNWGTTTARTDANCAGGTRSSDWVPGIGGLPQSDGSSVGVGGYPGCYIYASDGTVYIVSAWNMIKDPQTTTMYRRLGFREMGPTHITGIYYICNHPNVGGMYTGSYVADTDYYKHSMTLSNITTASCGETPPAGA